MKNIFLLLIVFTSTHAFAQTVNESWSRKFTPVKVSQSRDSSLKVVMIKNDNQERQPACFVNSMFIKNIGLIKPEQIESINVVKRDTLIGTQKYLGQIYITTKDDYTPKFISLAELKYKYTSFKETPVVFTIDADVINSDEESYFVDENNLLTIIVDTLKTNKDTVKIGLIKLLTKTKKNIDSRNNIMIRGEDIELGSAGFLMETSK